MVELNLEKLNPLKTEALSLVENIKKTVVSLPEGKTGYDLMKEHKRSLQKFRTNAVENFKGARKYYNDAAKAIIELEKEVLAITSPAEEELAQKIAEIDQAELRAKRIEMLPTRKEVLALIEVVVSDEELLDMNEVEFSSFLNNKKSEYLEAKEAKIRAEAEEQERKNQEEEARLQKERDAIEEQKRLEEARREAERLATEKAIRDAELAKKQAEIDKAKALKEAEEKAEREKKEALAKAEAEKQAIIDEQNRKDQERLDEEARIANEAKQKEQEELVEKERIEKMKKWQKFLSDNGWTEDTRSDFHTAKSEDGKTITLYKKLAEFKI